MASPSTQRSRGPRKSLSLSSATDMNLKRLHSQLAMAVGATTGQGNPFQPGAAALIVSDFYQQLFATLLTEPVYLRIPETLFLSPTGEEVLIVSDSNSVLRAYPKASFSQFTELCQHYTQSSAYRDLSEFPLCIAYTANAEYKVFFDFEEAEKYWNSLHDPSKIMQRYIPSASRIPSKLRLIWKNGAFQRYLIQKRGIEVLLRPKSPTQCPFVKVSAPNISEEIDTGNCSFVVSSRAEGDYEWKLLDTRLVLAENFCNTVARVMRVDKDAVGEMAYDVIQDYEDMYYFLNLKWIQPTSTPSHAPRSHKLRQKFTEVMSAGQTGKVPFVDMSEVTANNVKLYLSQVATAGTAPNSVASTPTSVDTSYESGLNEAGQKLDSLARIVTTERQKHEYEQRLKLDSYPNSNILDSIISKVYARVTADEELKEHFEGMGEHAIKMIKMGFTKAFLGVDNYYFKKTVKRAHVGMCISSKQFQKFTEIFAAVMQEEGVRSEDISIVCRHLSRFSDEVVEVDS